MKTNTILFLVGRNLGDAVIQSKYILSIVDHLRGWRIIVWTRPLMKSLFDSPVIDKVFVSEFPMGTNKNLTMAGLRSLFQSIYGLRNLDITVSCDFMGDFREVLLCNIVCNGRHYTPSWAPGHPMADMVRGNRFLINGVKVPAGVGSIYTAYRLFSKEIVDELGGQGDEIRFSSVKSCPKPGGKQINSQIIVGLHPFTSLKWREWPLARWCQLAEHIIASGWRVCIFTSADRQVEAEEIRFRNGGAPALVCVPFWKLGNEIEKVQLFVGMDSLGVHLASLKGVKTVMINGPTVPNMWLPEDGVGVWNSGGCDKYPCMNTPSCLGKKDEVACIRVISVDEVFAKMKEILNVRATQERVILDQTAR